MRICINFLVSSAMRMLVNLSGREAVEMAEQLVDEQAGVAIYAFGVGRGVDKTELEKIINVCGPHADNRYMALCTNDEAPW